MIRTLFLACAMFVVLACNVQAAQDAWVVVTTWDGQKITLGDFGFYESSNWDNLSDYDEHRQKLTVGYEGAYREIRLKEIRRISNSPRRFTEHFGEIVLEMADGTSLVCEGPDWITGLVGKDRMGVVRIPGRRIKSIEFLWPVKEGGRGEGKATKS